VATGTAHWCGHLSLDTDVHKLETSSIMEEAFINQNIRKIGAEITMGRCG
jgi:hypothetical protein